MSVRGGHAATDVTLQGCYAGCVTRLLAFAIDVVAALSIFALAANVVEYVVSALLGHQVRLREVPFVAVLLLVSWFIVFFTYPVAQTGRTLGKALLGLRIVRADGAVLDAKRALVRTLVLPVSTALAGIGLAMVLVRRDRRALHDIVASSAVVYAWDARAARLRFLAGRQPSTDAS